jgi:hypothetical protein
LSGPYGGTIVVWTNLLRLGEEFVFVDHRGYCHFAFAVVDTNYLAFTAHTNAFREPGAIAEST